MDFRYYIALCLILVAPSCCSTREERLTRTTWGLVPVADKDKYNYLALLEHGTVGRSAQYCSGSIISPSAVLTYCTGKPTVAYAGLDNAGGGNELKATKQEQTVTDVKECPQDVNLKICKVENWNFDDDVDQIKLVLTEDSEPSYDNCFVLGFGGNNGAAQKMLIQKIGQTTECTPGAGRDTDGVFYSKVDTVETQQLKAADLGGPALCDDVQRGISKEFKAADGQTISNCNLFVKIGTHREWISREMQEEAAEPVGNNGTDGKPSSGYSIHSDLNKYSQWKVLLLLCLMAIKFFAY